MKKVTIFTDGACSGNPGKGGWAAILRYKYHEREISGSEVYTTNNRMELLAVINALKCLKYPCDVTIWTDSMYVCESIEKKWVFNWEKSGWKQKNGKFRLNHDLWKELLELLRLHKYKFNWIRGHSGHPENERCDELARMEILKLN